MLNYKTYNESLFFTSKETLLVELRKDIIEYEIILNKLINLSSISFKNDYFNRMFYTYYLKFFKYRLHITEKFNKLLRKKNITQEVLNSMTTLWKRFEKIITLKYGIYDSKKEEEKYLIINTITELSKFLVLVDDLKNEYDIDINAKDKFTLTTHRSEESCYFICRESAQKAIDKKRKEKRAKYTDVDPLGEENWEVNENAYYHINELFDIDNIYHWKFISKETKKR